MTHEKGERRGIPKLPEAPDMDEGLVAALTALIFMPDAPVTPADLLFVFGSGRYPDLVASRVQGLLDKQLTRLVVVAGGAPAYEDSVGADVPESARIIALVGPSSYPDVEFVAETASWNTTENVAFAARLMDLSSVASAGFIIPAHGARRAYSTLRKHLPDADLRPYTYVARHVEDGAVLSAEEWHLGEAGRRRVWGEFLRLVEYDRQGTIDIDEVRDAVAGIAERTGIS